jgi:beta-glucosidase/6-phospho-beta-glucosidase/beta-galactosidase
VDPEFVEDFEHYADVLFKHFGDRVKTWMVRRPGVMVCLLLAWAGVGAAWARRPSNPRP